MESHSHADLIPVGGYTIFKESDKTYSLFRGMERFATGIHRISEARKICKDLPYHTIEEAIAKNGVEHITIEKNPADLRNSRPF